MKERKDIWMLPVALLSLVLALLLFAHWVEWITIPIWKEITKVSGVANVLAIASMGLPFLFVQLWLNRNAKYDWLKWVPICLVVGTSFLLFLGLMAASGWDQLSYIILLIMCIPPVVGCGIGVIVHKILKKKTKKL